MRGRSLLVAAFALVATAVQPHPAVADSLCNAAEFAVSTVYLPNVTKTLGGPDGWVTPFIVQNVGTDPTTIDMSFYRFSDGVLVGCRRITSIAPGTSFAEIPNQDADLPGDTQFSVVVRSFASNIVAVVNESRGSGSTTQSASYTGSNSGARRVYLPNVTRRFYGYGVPFIVQNVGTIISSVTANFTSFDGQQQLYQSRLVMPGRSTVFDPDVIAGLTDGTQYSVVVNSDQPVAVVANAHNELVGPVAYAHNGLTTGSPALYAPYVAKSGPGATTDNDSPVVIQNVGNFDVDVTLKFIPLGATDVDTTAQTFVLPAIHSLTARVFDPRFAFDPFIGTTGGALCHVKGVNCLGPGEYSLIMSGNGAIAAVVLPTGPATAAAYVAQTSTGAGSHAFLPNVTRNLGGRAGWTTPFAVQSINATNAIFRWYRFSDGSLVKTETRRLVPGAALWIDPRDISGLADDAQYSLDIGGELGGSSGQLTAIVYERATGGDSAMIYEGFPGN